MAAYNFARRLKTLSGLTPYEYICKIWTSECSESDICYRFPLIWSSASSARRSRARMSSAVLLQTKGFGLALCCNR